MGQTCHEADVPVTTSTVTGAIHGRLCLPAGPAPNTVLVLVPGATYNSSYWDFPTAPEIYSFAKAMTNAGYATFSLDRLGTGRSTRPLSVQVTALIEAQAVHGVIKALRAGDVADTSFDEVVIGGHSLGSGIAIIEAATYHDVDALLVTGLSHMVNIVNTFLLFSVYTHSVALDSRFPDHDPGYFTTVPGMRTKAFHSPDTVDPRVAATDEALRDTASYSEVPDFVALGVVTPYSALIRVPVLIAIGERDPYFCGLLLPVCSQVALAVREKAYYPSAPSLHTYVLPTAGHSINLNPDTALVHAAVIDWINSVT